MVLIASPRPPPELDAESVDVGLVCCAVPTSQVELVWKPVQARHRLLHISPPMCEEATVRWLLVWRLDSMAADAGDSRLLTMVSSRAGAGGAVSRSDTFLFLSPAASRARSWRRVGRGPQRPAAWLTAIGHFG
jgi:hypothetical protein